MADGFHIRVTGDDEAQKRIERLALHLSDLRGFWPLLVPVVTSWWKRQFDTEGGFAGNPWQALSPVTVDAKAALGLRPEILQATGQLKQAASRPERSVTPVSLTLTIDDSGPAHGPVLGYHQEGDGVPQRPLVFGDPLPPAASAELQAAADTYVRDLLARL